MFFQNYRHPLIICLISSVLFNASCASHQLSQREANWATPLEAPGLENFYVVSTDLYRAAQPKKGGLSSASELGIKTVISIRETDLDQKLNEKEQTPLQLIHIPLVTSAVTTDQAIEVLKAIMESPKPVLVHCRHGSDRTGLIISLYRVIFQHWEKQEAAGELVNGGYGYHKMFPNIPELLMDADTDYINSKLGNNE